MAKKDLINIETDILEFPEDPKTAPRVKAFNENANAPYYYKWTETLKTFMGIETGTKKIAEKTPLPIYRGRQLTLKDIRQTAKEEGLTWEESLKRAIELGNKK